MTLTRIKRIYEVAVWPLLLTICSYASRLLDNAIVLVLALLVLEFDVVVLHLFIAVYVASQWWNCWTLGEHFRPHHHHNLWLRVIGHKNHRAKAKAQKISMERIKDRHEV